MSRSPFHLVITGDVVASSSMETGSRSTLPDQLRKSFAEIRQGRQKALPYDLDVYGGDGWQVYSNDPLVGLVVAVYMRARMRERANVDMRAAIALDAVDFLQPERVSESDGAAFRRSGRALTEMAKRERLRYLLPVECEQEIAYRIAADGVADLVDYAALQWTQSQAQAVAQMVIAYPDRPRQRDIAASWRPTSISQPAVNKHLKSGGWEWIERALERYEALTSAILNDALPSSR